MHEKEGTPICGIFGFATSETNNYNNKRKEVFLNGLFFQMPRGMDATGICGIRDGWSEGKKTTFVSQYKRAMHYLDYVGTKGAGRLLDKINDYYFLIGHVRAATMGRYEDNCAHPFEYGHITLAHNGTVTNREVLVKAEESVDSAYVAANMAAKGEVETLEKLEGGYSLVWYNSKDDSLNFARNDRKPMAVAFAKGFKTMYYASEYSTLWNVLVRNGVEIAGQISIPRPGVHYKFFKEDLRAFKHEGFQIYARPQPPSGQSRQQRPASEGTTQQVTVHRTEQDTINGAPASDAKTQEPESPGTSLTSKGNVSLLPGFINPSPPRQEEINRKLAKFNFIYGQRLVLKPTGLDTWARTPEKGTLYFDRILGGPNPEYTFVQVFGKVEDYERWKKVGFCAMEIRNVMDKGVEKRLKIVVVPEEDLQGVLDRRDDSLGKLAAHGFLPDKEVPAETSAKSGHNEHVYESDKRVHRVVSGVSVEEQDIIDADHVEKEFNTFVEGPNGTKITFARFREYCTRGCGYCTNPVDPDQHPAMSWFGEEPLCPGCTKSEYAQRDLQMERGVKQGNGTPSGYVWSNEKKAYIKAVH